MQHDMHYTDADVCKVLTEGTRDVLDSLWTFSNRDSREMERNCHNLRVLTAARLEQELSLMPSLEELLRQRGVVGAHQFLGRYFATAANTPYIYVGNFVMGSYKDQLATVCHLYDKTLESFGIHSAEDDYTESSRSTRRTWTTMLSPPALDRPPPVQGARGPHAHLSHADIAAAGNGAAAAPKVAIAAQPRLEQSNHQRPDAERAGTRVYDANAEQVNARVSAVDSGGQGRGHDRPATYVLVSGATELSPDAERQDTVRPGRRVSMTDGAGNGRDMERPNTRIMAIDERAIDERAIDERAIDERVADDRAVGDRAVNGRAVEDRAVDERAMDERAMDERAVDERAVDKRAMDERAVDERAVDERAMNDRAMDDRATTEEVLGTRVRADVSHPVGVASDSSASANVQLARGTHVSVMPDDSVSNVLGLKSTSRDGDAARHENFAVDNQFMDTHITAEDLRQISAGKQRGPGDHTGLLRVRDTHVNHDMQRDDHQHAEGGYDAHDARDGAHDARDGAHDARDGAHGARDGAHGARDGAHGARDEAHDARDGAHSARDGARAAHDRAHNTYDTQAVARGFDMNAKVVTAPASNNDFQPTLRPSMAVTRAPDRFASIRARPWVSHAAVATSLAGGVASALCSESSAIADPASSLHRFTAEPPSNLASHRPLRQDVHGDALRGLEAERIASSFAAKQPSARPL